jgi:hypothetical protein
MFPGGAPCSNTGEQGRREEISAGDSGGGGDPDGTNGGVLGPMDEGLPSAEGERHRLVPLLSSIASKLRTGERETLNERRKNARWASVHNKGDIYSTGSVVPLQ